MPTGASGEMMSDNSGSTGVEGGTDVGGRWVRDDITAGVRGSIGPVTGFALIVTQCY